VITNLGGATAVVGVAGSRRTYRTGPPPTSRQIPHAALAPAHPAIALVRFGTQTDRRSMVPMAAAFALPEL
jgi:hypothetical protein